MARLLQAFRRVLGLVPSSVSPARPAWNQTIDTDFSVFREGDRAIVQGRNPLLTKPLKHGDRTEIARGYLNHSDIIGSPVWGTVQTHKGKEHRLSLPTLEEYVVYTPRLVTPIYGADANLIVSLLDIHAVSSDKAPDGHGNRIEILEAGTGHGSLTLHLARAIHAANAVPPPLPSKSQVRIVEERSIRPHEDEKNPQHQTADDTVDDSNDAARQNDWDSWCARRSAIIHTVDVSQKFSTHAERIVRGFRRGMYAGNVDFHVGAVEDWIKDQMMRRRRSNDSNIARAIFRRGDGTAADSSPAETFLTHAILDMPSAHQRIAHVAPAVRPNGLLAVFMPSITQIGECVQLIQNEKLPFVMDKVVELGMGISSGRLWDVRMAVKKSRADPSSWARENEDRSATDGNKEQSTIQSGDSIELGDDSISREETPRDNVLVCRPKVGSKIVGGGFVGLWRKKN